MKARSNLLLFRCLLAMLATSAIAISRANAQFVRMPDLPNSSAYSFGCAWGDYNGDGYIDLAVANGFTASQKIDIYRNNKDGTFTRMTTNEVGTVVGESREWVIVRWADMNGDGNLDLLASDGINYSGQDHIFLNNGQGAFSHVSGGDLSRFSSGAGWVLPVDYDGDGILDLLAHHTRTSMGITGRLYRGNGDGTLKLITSIPLDPCEANSVVWSDYDGDGDPDLFVAQYWARPDHVYRNDGGGSFTRITTGLLGNSPANSMNPAWGDYDNDGDLDLALTKAGTPILLRNDGTNFSYGPTLPYAGGSPIWFDYDNDGLLDLFFAQGQGGSMRNVLARNNGDGTFTSVSNAITADGEGWTGVSCGDFNNDGFPDMFVTSSTGRTALYRNLGNTNHWIKFKLVGTASNRDAFGAKVRVLATIRGQSVWQMREVSSGNYFQDEPRLNFGLGDATVVERWRIEWPSGNVQEQEWTSQSVDRIVTVTEVVGITPVRPTASIGGSVTLTAQRAGTRQWYHEGAILEGQTNRTLNLSNIQVADGGRYGVVTSSGGNFYTNFVYLFVDTQFTKITTEPMCADRGYFFSCVWGDYDNDGFSDLFVNDGAWFRTTANHLYRNKGNGTFARMTTSDVGSLVGDLGGWRGCAWGDYDNNGFLDLYVTQDNGLRYLYHNNGDGRFTRVTTNGPIVTEAGYGNGVSWGDYDSDGSLDLFVATALNSSTPNSLYHNKGDGTFTKVTTGPIPADRPAGGFATFGGAWSDFDNDGDLDLVAGGGYGPIFVYRNGGAGQFSKITTGELPQDSAAPMYFAWGDYDNDGILDLFCGEWNQQCRLFHNNGGGQFSRSLFPPGSYEMRGGVWGDYDNDGYLDLFIPIGGYSPGQSLLYHNNGDGTFTRVTTGSLYSDLGHAQCAAWCDYDNDGFLDLFVGYCYDEPNSLYHNNGNSNNWLLFKLLGTKSNRAAIGAKVRVKATIGGKTFWQLREISGGDGFQNDLRPHFGLGNATVAQVVRIEWPSGVVEEFSNIAPRQILNVVEPNLSGALRGDGKFHLYMTMSTHRLYCLEASSDLVTWTALTNCMGSGSCTPIEYVDPEAPAAGTARFYRIK